MSVFLYFLVLSDFLFFAGMGGGGRSKVREGVAERSGCGGRGGA